MYDMSHLKKVRRCIRLDGDIDYMLPALIKRRGLKESLSDFVREAVKERFYRLVESDRGENEKG